MDVAGVGVTIIKVVPESVMCLLKIQVQFCSNADSTLFKYRLSPAQMQIQSRSNAGPALLKCVLKFAQVQDQPCSHAGSTLLKCSDELSVLVF